MENVSLSRVISATFLLVSTLGLIIIIIFNFSMSYNDLKHKWEEAITWQMQELSWLVSGEFNKNKTSIMQRAIEVPGIQKLNLMENQITLISLIKGNDSILFENHIDDYSRVHSELALDSNKLYISADSIFGKFIVYMPIESTNQSIKSPILVAQYNFSYEFNRLILLTIKMGLAFLGLNLFLNYLLFRLMSNYIIRPVNALVQHTALSHQRNFSDNIPWQKTKELNQLAFSINDIQKRIKKTVDDLEHNQALYKIFADALPQACAMVKMDGGIVAKFGPEDTLFAGGNSSNRIMDFIPNNSDLLLISKIRDCHGLRKTLHAEINIGTEDIQVHYDFSFTPVTEPVVGEPVTLITAQNVSQRKEHEQTLSLLASVFESREAIAITDANNQIIRVNHEFCRITGYQEEELIFGTMETCASPKHDQNFWDMIWSNVLEQGSWAGELTLQKNDGKVIPIRQTVSTVRNNQNQVQNFVIVFSDITEHKKAMSLVRYHANFDTLTDLPNRRLFMNQLSRSMSFANRHKFYSALIFVDLDNFKQINDSYGHPVGDKVLIEISKRIKIRIRKEDFLARLSGDEFVVLLSHLGTDEKSSAKKAQQLANTILREIRLPVETEQRSFLTTASLGITLFSESPNTAFDIMREADTAMYQAKTRGKNLISFFSKDMQATVKKALNLAHRISRAIDEKEFRVFYQPQFDELSQLIGMEALVRWNPKSGESLSPADFIPVAEESGKIVELGDFILFEALKHLQKMIEAGLPDSFRRLAINISPRQFMDSDFEARIQEAIELTQVPPSKVELEITEGSLMDNNEQAQALLERLKSMGFAIAIDDFGTGYSSLAYLKSLPIDKLKIDQYFVRDIVRSESDAQIVKTIISMAHAMGLQVIAEGVETKEQLDFLRQNSCLEYQGYYFSKPISFSDIMKRYFNTRKVKG